MTYSYLSQIIYFTYQSIGSVKQFLLKNKEIMIVVTINNEFYYKQWILRVTNTLQFEEL